MGVWRATLKPERSFLALCSSNTPIIGIQKHLCCGMGYSGMPVWGATPEPKRYFLALCSSNTPIIGIHNPFAVLWDTVVTAFGAPPRNQTIFFDIVQLKHPHHRYSKLLMLSYGVQWGRHLGRHPETKQYFWALCSTNTTT